MSSSQMLYGALVVAFAGWVTVHVVTAGALFLTARKKHAVLAFLVPPAAPIIAFRDRERALAIIWVVLAATYLGLFLYART